MNVFMSTWALLVAGLVFALPMIYMRVTNHTEYLDETLCVSPIKYNIVGFSKDFQGENG